MAKILIVEDDQSVSRNLKTWLQKENHLVETVADGTEGLYLLLNYSYDIAIVDWQLPGKQGFEICQELKSSNVETPVLMLTSKSAINDRITGLDSGAYDYVVKPCDLTELSARIRALLRRPGEISSDDIQVGNVQIDLLSHEVKVNNAKIRISPSEFDLLLKLCRNLGSVISPEHLKAGSRSHKEIITNELLRVQIASLRRKLNSAGAQLEITNVRGMGYSATLQKVQLD